ncbi:unnamed protein product [Spirodela intermedia]|uniref:Uncharacterized protein n=1 Tax=Spirodela intermedia TaxID=51605 RepID=A0A7I8KBY8_SPIIN|nr:unnamed protein product [Spirodela intermedia]
MCYVGKATKIFIGVVAVLAVAGLVLGLGVRRNGPRRAAPTECDGDVEGGSCDGFRPGYPEPRPAAPGSGSPPPPPLFISPPASPSAPAVPPTRSPAAATAPTEHRWDPVRI